MTQPILLVLVFGNILPRLGSSPTPSARHAARTDVISILMAGVQSVLMPLVTDLGGTERSMSASSRRSASVKWRWARSWRAPSTRHSRGCWRCGHGVSEHRLAGSNISPNWVVLLPFTILAA